MGKNKNKETPDPNSISNRDIIQRLNFLYQASVFLSSVSPHAPHLPGSPPGEAQNGLNPRHSRRQKRTITTSELSKRYIDTMKIVGQKTNVRMSVLVLSSVRCVLTLISQRSFPEAPLVQVLPCSTYSGCVRYNPSQGLALARSPRFLHLPSLSDGAPHTCSPSSVY